MPRIDIVNLIKELGRGQLRPIYIIVGQEAHLALAALGEIRGAVQRLGSDAVSATSFTGREVKAETVLGNLKTVPMLGGRPLVVIREGEDLSKANQDILAEYIGKPIDSSTLVIMAEKLDGRGRLMQAAAKGAAVIECKPLYIDKVPYWINSEVKKRGRTISQQAAEMMATMIGTDLGELSQAIERVILYAGERKMLNDKDVAAAIAETHQYRVFDFADAVGSRNWPKAFALLSNLVENGQSPVFVLAMLARHFRILLKAREATGKMEPGRIASYIGVHPYFAKGCIAQSKNFSAGELRAAFRIMHRCDRELKSSPVPKERIMERALFELMGKKGAPPGAEGRRIARLFACTTRPGEPPW